MFYRTAIGAVILAAGLALAGCSTIVTALLINELLNDEAPKRTWTGTVTDTTGEPVGGLLVQVRAEIEGDDDILSFSDTTGLDGKYQIGYRWHKEVEYTVRVVFDSVVFAEEFIGQIELKDQVTDFVIQGAVSTALSGVVRDHLGDPIKGVVVIGASAAALDDTPVAILDSEGELQFALTGDSGVYEIEGSVGKYGIACAFHPDHGFAYAFDEDDDANGSIPLNIDMGAPGTYEVSVQVVDGTVAPLANQVLSADRRFRLRLYQPFNLGSIVDQVVADQGLFPGLVGDPSGLHQSTVTISVLSTGDDGIAQLSEDATGGNYSIELLEVDSDEPATALVLSETPLVLFEDTAVVVRVN